MMFRDPKNALLPNWLHIPVGYHGRSSTIVPSGMPVNRPLGQTLPKGETQPIFGESKRVDFELETAFITTDANIMGDRVSVEDAENFIFGMVLLNDWSARDIQSWEYVPLGSEERRVGKECRSRWSRYHLKKEDGMVCVGG